MVSSDINLSPSSHHPALAFVQKADNQPFPRSYVKAPICTHLLKARLNNRAALKIICLRFTFYSALLLFNCQSHRIIAVMYCRSGKKLLRGLNMELILSIQKKIGHERSDIKTFQIMLLFTIG